MSIQNTFPIDLVSIKGILDDLNIENISDFHALMDEIARLPIDIDKKEAIEKSLLLIEKIKKEEKKFKEFRLQDQRPFKEAIKVITEFYKFYEDALKEKKLLLQEKISDFANNQDMFKKSNSNKVKNFFSKLKEPEKSDENKNLSFDREWIISNIDQKRLDLESLRNHFTDYQLKTAIKKHLKSNGPILEGVEYEQKIKI